MTRDTERKKSKVLHGITRTQLQRIQNNNKWNKKNMKEKIIQSENYYRKLIFLMKEKKKGERYLKGVEMK